MSDYVPRNDANFLLWAQTFADTIAASPGTYMVTSAQAQSISDAVDLFEQKLIICSADATRTKLTINDKDNARNAAETLCRQYAMMFKDNYGISDSAKLAAGVRPINPDRTPIDVPQTQPLLNILGNTPGAQTVVYADSTTPDSKAKPFGASELQLFMAVTDTDTATFADAQFYGKFTRNPIGVEFTADQNQKVATYWARWASVRGETGPFSLPISMAIAA